jgi:hemerythrin-like domain-containing protein
MNPIQVLMDEHRVIEQAIDALGAYSDAVVAGADHPREDLAELVAFIRGFADRHHHGKEEDILFRVMAEEGMPTHAGPLAVMLFEHEQGRQLTAALGELAESDGAWTGMHRDELDQIAYGYAQLLLAHIQKEDNILYPMADQRLGKEAWNHIDAAFEAFESEPDNIAAAARFRESARNLAERYHN